VPQLEREYDVELVFDHKGNHVKRPSTQAPSSNAVTTAQVDVQSSGKRSISFSDLNTEKLVAELDQLTQDVKS
jgi:hypothetical protein